MADDNGSLRLLIVNADDFGYCEQRNRGIVTSFQDGIVSSASLLVNAESALEAIQLSKKCGIPLGIHLNLTEGRPMETHCKSLTSEEGFLRGKFGFREALKNREVDLDEVNFKLNRDYRVSRDANLWRPKIGRFFTSPPEFQRPPRKTDPAPNGNDLKHYMTSYMMYILSKFECWK